jgi:hypothetical protein
MRLVIVELCLLIVLVRDGSLSQDGPDVASAVKDMQYLHVVFLDLVDDDVAADSQASQSGTKIIAFPTQVWMLSQFQKPFRYGVDDAIGNLGTGTLRCIVQPDFV